MRKPFYATREDSDSIFTGRRKGSLYGDMGYEFGGNNGFAGVRLEEPKKCPKCKQLFASCWEIKGCKDHEGKEALYGKGIQV